MFDAVDFNRLFWKDKALVKAFRDWKAGAKAAIDTDFFYKSIAGKKLAALEGELRAAYVDLRPGLAAKAADPTADTAALEAAVDAAVAALYGVALPAA